MARQHLQALLHLCALCFAVLGPAAAVTGDAGPAESPADGAQHSFFLVEREQEPQSWGVAVPGVDAASALSQRTSDAAESFRKACDQLRAAAAAGAAQDSNSDVAKLCSRLFAEAAAPAKAQAVVAAPAQVPATPAEPVTATATQPAALQPGNGAAIVEAEQPAAEPEAAHSSSAEGADTRPVQMTASQTKLTVVEDGAAADELNAAGSTSPARQSLGSVMPVKLRMDVCLATVQEAETGVQSVQDVRMLSNRVAPICESVAAQSLGGHVAAASSLLAVQAWCAELDGRLVSSLETAFLFAMKPKEASEQAGRADGSAPGPYAYATRRQFCARVAASEVAEATPAEATPWLTACRSLLASPAQSQLRDSCALALSQKLASAAAAQNVSLGWAQDACDDMARGFLTAQQSIETAQPQGKWARDLYCQAYAEAASLTGTVSSTAPPAAVVQNLEQRASSDLARLRDRAHAKTMRRHAAVPTAAPVLDPQQRASEDLARLRGRARAKTLRKHAAVRA